MDRSERFEHGKKTELLGCVRLWLISPGDLRSMVMATRLFSKQPSKKPWEYKPALCPLRVQTHEEEPVNLVRSSIFICRRPLFDIYFFWYRCSQLV